MANLYANVLQVDRPERLRECFGMLTDRRIASTMVWPCETRTSTCRNFATISSGLYRFLAITVLLDVKDIPQVGPLQWGRITVIPSSEEAGFTPVDALLTGDDGWIAYLLNARACARDHG
jgi:hypothetical protein